MHQTILKIALLVALVGVAAPSWAQKKGGGGGGGTVPAGTIHFLQWPDPNDGTSTPRSMKADGSGKTASIRGEPTYQLHEGRRWFADSIQTSGWPDDPSAELVAVADNGEMLFLGVEAGDLIGARWAKDGLFLSFVAIIDAPEGRSAGLYVANVDWSLGHPVLAEPAKVLNVHLYDDYYPDIWFWDWSPAGDELVCLREAPYSTYSLEVVRFLADGTTQVHTLKQHALYPQWSPDGRRIAFLDQMDGAIKTILPNGTGLVKLTNPNSGQFAYHTEPSWSPDSQHLVFTEVTRNRLQKGQYWYTYSYNIHRVSATGGGTTNLTSDTSQSCVAIAWR
jgi:hypothetical protein